MCRHRGPPEKLGLPKRFEISQLGGRPQKCRPSRPLGKLCLTGRSYRAQFDPTSADHRRNSFSDLVKRNAFSSCANARAAAELNTARLRSEAAEATVQLRRLAGHGRRRVTIGAVGARSAAVVARSNASSGSRLYIIIGPRGYSHSGTMSNPTISKAIRFHNPERLASLAGSKWIVYQDLSPIGYVGR